MFIYNEKVRLKIHSHIFFFVARSVMFVNVLIKTFSWCVISLCQFWNNLGGVFVHIFRNRFISSEVFSYLLRSFWEIFAGTFLLRLPPHWVAIFFWCSFLYFSIISILNIQLFWPVLNRFKKGFCKLDFFPVFNFSDF